MIVCVCEGVSDREVREAITEGSRTLQDLGRSCGAGTDCASCCMTLRQMLDEHRPRQNERAPSK